MLWHCFSVRAASGSQDHCLCSLSPSQVAAEPSSMPSWPCNLTLSAYISTKLYLPLCACRDHRISRQAWNTAWAADAHAVGTSGLASQSWDYGSGSKHWACKIDTDHNRDAALDLVLRVPWYFVDLTLACKIPFDHRKFFFLLVRVYWLRCHSESPSLLSRAPPRISKGRRLILGPTSLSSQES